MPYALADHVTYRCLDDHAVFLDLAADRYSCLPPTPARVFGQWIADGAKSDPSSLGLGTLIRAGLIRARTETSRVVPCERPAPDNSFFDTVRVRSGVGDTVLAAGQLLTAARLLRRRPLLELLTKLAGRGEPAEVNRPPDTIVAAHRGLVAWTSGHRDCLLRSTALARHLRLARQPFTFVFGVKLGPFGAHCWIEQDGAILSDSYDHVAAFTPIAAL